MKIASRIASGSLSSRLDAERISARLRADIERELQASVTSEQLLDPDQRRAAVERAVRRLAGVPL